MNKLFDVVTRWFRKRRYKPSPLADDAANLARYHVVTTPTKKGEFVKYGKFEGGA